MTLEEKIDKVYEYRDAILAALNGYLDRIYDLTDTYFNEKGELIEGLEKDEKVEGFIKELHDIDAPKYESVRAKVNIYNRELTITDIDYIMLALVYTQKKMESQKRDLKAGLKLTDELIGIFKE